MNRRFSLFAAPKDGNTDALKRRLTQIAAHSHHKHTEKHTLFRADGRQPRPPLRLIQQDHDKVILQYCSFPDTNASLRTTSEQVLEVFCESDLAGVECFLVDCGYTRLANYMEYVVETCRVRGCHITTYTDNQSVFVRVSGEAEDEVLQVSKLFSDSISFEHVDNALIR